MTKPDIGKRVRSAQAAMKESVLRSRLGAELMQIEPYRVWEPEMVLALETERMIEILTRRDRWTTFARKYNLR